MTEKHYHVFKGDIVDNLTSTDTDKPLSANQGRVLNSKVTYGTAVPSATGNTGDLYVKFSNIPSGYLAIGTPQELADFATRVNNGETTLNAYLSADLDMTGVTCSGIGTSTAYYTGVFNGCGHIISNISADHSLFDYLGTGRIANVGMKDCTLTSVFDGGLLLHRSYGGTIENCFVADSSIKGSYCTAGLLGLTYNSTKVANCYCYNITLTGTYAGGLISFVRDTTVSNCAIYGGSKGDTLYNNPLGVTTTNCYTSASEGVTSDVFHTKGFWDGTGVSGTTYLSWDFADTWDWDSASSLPKLKVISADTGLYTYNGSAWIKIGS